jgi:DNA-binding Lrp family transcriptional regulator
MPTAAWPTPSLLTSLSRAGWGDMSGRSMQGVRSTLRGLADLLPHGSGEGLATACQIAETAGLSERWVRRCLHLLEDAGVIRWVRGGVNAGTPLPSWFRIEKRVLVELIALARPIANAARAIRATVTRERLARFRWLPPRDRQTRRSVHAELSASPAPYREGPRDFRPEIEDTNPQRDALYTAGRAAVDAALAAVRRRT